MHSLLHVVSFGLMLPGLVFASGFVLLGHAIFVRVRWLAGLCVAILSAASAVVMVALGSAPFSEGRWFFLLPGMAALCIGAWLAAKEWPR